jgi:hypothetical protein
MAIPITYTNFVPPAMDAGNMNTVNSVVYTIIGDGTNAPISGAQVRTNIGLGAVATLNTIPVANGGTGATTAATARTNLSVPQIGPAFSASLSANQAVANGAATIIIYDSEDFDTDNTYNNSTGVFTPTVSGYYQISFGALVDANGSTLTSATAILYKNGSLYFRGAQANVGAAAVLTDFDSTGSVLVFMNGTTDFVDIRSFSSVSAGAPRILGANGGRFTAAFIRP